MGDTTSIRSILNELRAHAVGGGDDALLDLVIEMESKLTESGSSISVGNISNSTAVAIGNGIDIVVHQSNLPEALLSRLNALVDTLEKPAMEHLPVWPKGKNHPWCGPGWFRVCAKARCMAVKIGKSLSSLRMRLEKATRSMC